MIEVVSNIVGVALFAALTIIGSTFVIGVILGLIITS